MSISSSNFRLTLKYADPDYHVTLMHYDEDTELASDTVKGFNLKQFQSDYLASLSTYTERDFPHAALQALGAEVARLLLPPSVRRALLSRLWASPTSLFRLFVATPERLSMIPWEYVFLEADGQALERSQFFCLHPQIHLIRQQAHPRMEKGTEKAVAFQSLRVLLVWADPDTARYPRLPHLQQELSSIRAALRTSECRSIHLETLPSATRSGFQRYLQDFQPHIVHYLGHGDILPSGGALILEGGRVGSEDRLYGAELGEWMQHTACKLVVLSACHTASPVRGVAETLSAQGISAIVGMQLPMRSATSQAFARAFYSALGQACSVEVSLAQSRTAMDLSGPDWGVPVLYLAGKTGDLFTSMDTDSWEAKTAQTNLPYPPNPHFLGRDTEMALLHTAMQTKGRRVALVGLHGLGKTQLAVEYAHRYRDSYPGGIFWIHARDTLRVKDEYVTLSRLFDMPESLSYEDRVQRMRQRLQTLTQPALLIFDNLTADTDIELLPAMGLCHILVTTRIRYLAQQTFQTFTVPALDTKDSHALLCKTGREPSDTQDQADMEEIAALLGGLPLALSLVANHIRRLKVRFGDYLIRLKGQPHKMLAQARARFLTATQHDGSLFDAIEITCCELSPEALAVFGISACFAGRGISPDLLQEALNTEVSPMEADIFQEALAELEDYCLLARESDDRLTMHELVRVFARGRMSTEVCAQAIENVASVLKACLEEANSRMQWHSVRPEIMHCRAVKILCEESHAMENLPALLREMGLYEGAHGSFPAALDYLQASVTLVTTRYGRLHPEAAFLLMQIGNIKFSQKRHTEALAYQREALEIAQAVFEKDHDLAEYYNSTGVLLKACGQLDEAEVLLKQALAIYEQAYGHRHNNVARCLNNLGTLCETRGEWNEAMRYLQEALEIDTAIHGPEHVLIATRLNNLGRLLTLQGDFQDAMARHEMSLQIAENVYGRRHPDVAASLFYCGEVQSKLGQAQAARAFYLEASELYHHFYGADHQLSQLVHKRLAGLPD